MSNRIYPLNAQAIWNGTLDVDGVTLKAVLVKSGYSFSTAHQFLSSITGANRVATSDAQTSASSSSTGVLDSPDFAFAAIDSGAGTGVAFVIYKDTGSEATSPLLKYIDTPEGGTGLPYVPNGSPLTLRTPNGVLAMG